MEVMPCLVTRGDVDRILASFPKHWHDPIVYDNSVEPDLAVLALGYGVIAWA